MTVNARQVPPSRRSLSRVALPLLLIGSPTVLAAQWCPATGPEEAPERLGSTLALAPAREPGERMVIRGTVFAADGRTPQGGATIYAYQTNREGRYAADRDATGLAAWHGRLRGWLQTDSQGQYTIETIRPGSYPSRDEPQHVHLQVMPPGGVGCEIDAVEFGDDPLLTEQVRRSRNSYGGSGITTPERDARGVWQATRDIVLWDGARTDTLAIHVDSSELRWRGTKFGGRGAHEGTVRLAPGHVVLGGDRLLHGRLEIPLETLRVTDIPVWDPVPRSRLRTHLLGEDVFDAGRYPSAALELVSAQRIAPGRFSVFARLTIRDVTRSLRFEARLRRAPPESILAAEAAFRIDRQAWGLSYRGSRLGNDLVDDDIEFRIVLALDPRGG